jgi:hypothetical protein
VLNLSTGAEFKVIIDKKSRGIDLIEYLVSKDPDMLERNMAMLCESMYVLSKDELAKLPSSEILLVASSVHTNPVRRSSAHDTMSNIRATVYEEFALTKVNSKNKRESRVIAVDPQKLLKINPEAESSFLNGLLKKEHGSKKGEY